MITHHISQLPVFQPSMQVDISIETPIPSLVVVVTSRLGSGNLKGQLAIYDYDTEDCQITDWHGLRPDLNSALELAHNSVKTIVQIINAEVPEADELES